MPSIDDIAKALIDARTSGTPAVAALHTPADAEAAYAVQDRVARAFDWFTATPRHWKSGGASRGAPLTHAPLPPAGVWTSPAKAGDWPLRVRGIEAEIALRLGADVTPDVAARLDLDRARPFVDAMFVAIEIVESRWIESVDAPPLARLADLQSHGALVLGDGLPYDPQHDWGAQPCRVLIGDRPAAVFRGTHALSDPAFVLPGWLAHATRDGATLAAGTVVTTGTWCGVLFAGAGDRVEVGFDGIGSAVVEL